MNQALSVILILLLATFFAYLYWRYLNRTKGPLWWILGGVLLGLTIIISMALTMDVPWRWT